MSKPAQVDIDITQGEDFEAELAFSDDGVPVNITGYTFFGQIRDSASSTKRADFSFVITDAAGGKVKVSLARAVTATLNPGRPVYDWWQKVNNEDSPLMGGLATIHPRVTR